MNTNNIFFSPFIDWQFHFHILKLNLAFSDTDTRGYFYLTLLAKLIFLMRTITTYLYNIWVLELTTMMCYDCSSVCSLNVNGVFRRLFAATRRHQCEQLWIMMLGYPYLDWRHMNGHCPSHLDPFDIFWYNLLSDSRIYFHQVGYYEFLISDN